MDQHFIYCAIIAHDALQQLREQVPTLRGSQSRKTQGRQKRKGEETLEPGVAGPNI